MQLIRKAVLTFLCMVLLFSFLPLSPANTVKAAGETPLSYHADKNFRYFVGFFYYDMWRSGTTGQWQDGKAPNQGIHGEASHTYTFSFPGRTVKSVSARIFRETDPMEYFSDSRTDTYDEYRQWISNGTQNSDIEPYDSDVVGKGTSSVTIPVTVNMLLDAPNPLDITEMSCNPSCGEGVKGFRIYLPILFKIELATQLNVKYYTTDGQSLKSVFGERVNEEMTVGQTYTFTPPTNPKYQYAGYKKSTSADPPSGSLNTGEFSFTYNGSFEQFTIFLYYKADPDEPPPHEPTPPSCTAPVPGKTIDGKAMDPSVSAVIKADNRGAEKFDVSKGIPTSESLYGNVLANNYLYQDKFVQMTGTCTFHVDVNRTYHLTWDPGKKDADGKDVPDPQSDDETITRTYDIERPYSYWTIGGLEVYSIKEADLWNYAFNGNGIKITPSGYSAPYFATAKSGGFTAPDDPSPVEAPAGSKSGGKNRPDLSGEDLKSYADQAVGKVKVKNDTFTFNGKTVMSGAENEQTTAAPSQIDNPVTIGNNVLYSEGNVIPTSKTNKLDQASTGAIKYDLMQGNIGGGSDQSFAIPGINSVTVHTPVVIYASISDDQAHNQKTVPAAGRSATVLDRPFTIYMPTNGQHRNILGYGNRDYAKYIKTKQVYFPFDVYSADKSTFYPKDTWISIPVAQKSTTFYLPVWVDEGYYDVLFRSIAENAPTSFTSQPEANTDLANHVATDTVPVDVIGRLYDFRVTDVADPNWESVFRATKGSSTPTGRKYTVGASGIDGSSNGNTFPYVLPILRGSNPIAGFKSVAIKTGYHFKFDLKTKGNMYGEKDAIRITPSFYFQDNDASTPAKRVPVDLYYHSGTKKFIKIGSAEDTERRNIVLNARLRNVPASDIVNTAGSFYDLNSGWTVTRDQYLNQYIKRAGASTYVGGYDVQILPSPLRTFINPFTRPSNASASVARVNASVQQWYGEYSLPAAVYVVPKGTDLAAYGRKNTLDEKSPIFLKNGYITVNFNIETIRNADLNHPYLQYSKAPLDNQWWDMEGFDSADGSRDHRIKDAYGVQFEIQDGDVVFYDASKSSYDDYIPSGTH